VQFPSAAAQPGQLGLAQLVDHRVIQLQDFAACLPHGLHDPHGIEPLARPAPIREQTNRVLIPICDGTDSVARSSGRASGLSRPLRFRGLASPLPGFRLIRAGEPRTGRRRQKRPS